MIAKTGDQGIVYNSERWGGYRSSTPGGATCEHSHRSARLALHCLVDRMVDYVDGNASRLHVEVS